MSNKQLMPGLPLFKWSAKRWYSALLIYANRGTEDPKKIYMMMDFRSTSKSQKIGNNTVWDYKWCVKSTFGMELTVGYPELMCLSRFMDGDLMMLEEKTNESWEKSKVKTFLHMKNWASKCLAIGINTKWSMFIGIDDRAKNIKINVWLSQDDTLAIKKRIDSLRHNYYSNVFATVGDIEDTVNDALEQSQETTVDPDMPF